MALQNSWPGPSGVTDTTEARKDLAGLIETNGSGVARAGLFPAHTNAIVTARSDMNVDIAAFQGCAVQFGGPVLLANDGTIQLPSVLVSPGSGTNYYVVYVKQNESTAPGTDANNNVLAGATLSTASFTAARSALPAGALELATVQVPSGVAATNAVGVTITQSFQYTAAEGGVVLVRNSTELAAWTPGDGAVVFQLDTGGFYVRKSGGWVLVPGSSPAHFVLRKTVSFGWTATQTDHTWDAALLEGALGAFTTTDNITYTCVVPGVYSLMGSLASNTGTTSTDIFLFKNGTGVMTWNGAANGSYYTGHPFAATLRFAVGDTFKIQLGGSGGTLGLQGAGCFLAVDYIGV